VYFTARLRALGRAAEVKGVQRVALLPVVVASLLVAAVLAFFAPQIAGLTGAADGAGSARALVALALLLPLTTLSGTLLAATRGYASMLPTVAIDSVGRPLLQLGLVALVVTGGSLPVLAGAWALPWALSAALAAWWLSRLGREVGPAGARPAPETWRRFWTYTGPRAVTTVVQLALQRLDIILVAVLVGPAEAAVYTAATRFLVVGQSVATAVSTAAQPALAGLLAGDDRASARTVYQGATAWIVLLTWPVYLLSATFADPMLAAFGAGYTGGRPVVLVLAGAMLVATACGMVTMLLNMAGRTAWTLGNSLAALAVMVAVDLLLIPRLGILGAALGWAAAIVLTNVLALAQLWPTLRLHPFGPLTLRVLALASAAFGVVPWLVAWLLPDEPAVLGVLQLLAGAGYVWVVLRWRAALALPPLRTRSPRRSDASPDRPAAEPALPGGGR
jgi:O-antigen/teichoic acid export membrane protein